VLRAAQSLGIIGSVNLHPTVSRDVTEIDSPQTSREYLDKRERLETRLRYVG